MYKKLLRNIICLVSVLVSAGCTQTSVPKPYGYVRLTMPDTAYTPFSQCVPAGAYSSSQRVSAGAHSSSACVPAGAYPYDFQLSANAQAQPRQVAGEAYWINIVYPSLNATIHCSYKPVRGNLRELTADALEFVYKNASHASAIPEQDYASPDRRVYGVLFGLEGNTASSCQFFLTDSTHHFFRGAVYISAVPNADSLAPVNDYLRTDVIRLVESFHWTR